MRLSLCACIVLAAAVALPAAITVGDSYQKVLKEKGRPSGRIEAGSTLSLHYPEQVIKLERGKVVAIEAAPTLGKATAEEPPPLRQAKPAPARAVPAGATVKAGGWTTDYAAALREAKELRRRVLLLFTGADWSGNCMRLKHEILSTPVFRSYAATNLLLVEVEFPKTRALPPALKAQNEELRRLYGIHTFPIAVVLDSSGLQLGMLGYLEGGPKEFVAALENL